MVSPAQWWESKDWPLKTQRSLTCALNCLAKSDILLKDNFVIRILLTRLVMFGLEIYHWVIMPESGSFAVPQPYLLQANIFFKNIPFQHYAPLYCFLS